MTRENDTSSQSAAFSSSSVGAVVVAAGASRRMGGIDKVFSPVNGKPLLSWTVQVFQNCLAVQQIVLVVSEQRVEDARRLVRDQRWTKVKDVCKGGERRQDSVSEGLKRLSGCQWIVIHDGARPCLTSSIIEMGLTEASRTGAAIAAVPVKDTIKVVSEGVVQGTPPRQQLWAVQTPQVFRFDIIKRAYDLPSDEVTDDASLVEKLGCRAR